MSTPQITWDEPTAKPQSGAPQIKWDDEPASQSDPTKGTAYEGYARLGAGVKDAVTRLAHMPGAVYHSVADAPKNQDEQDMQNVGGRGAVAVKRLVTDPMAADFQKGKDDAAQGHYSEAAGHFGASALPVVGAFASHSGEAIGADPLRGGAELATNLLLPKAAGEGFKAVAPVVRSIPEMAPDLAAKASATGKLLGREATSRVPILNRFDKFTKPTFNDYKAAFTAKADPQLSLYNNTPKLGNSPLFSNQPELQSGNVRSTPMPDEAPVKGEDAMEEARRGGPGTNAEREADLSASKQRQSDFLQKSKENLAAQQKEVPNKAADIPKENPVNQYKKTESYKPMSFTSQGYAPVEPKSMVEQFGSPNKPRSSVAKNQRSMVNDIAKSSDMNSPQMAHSFMDQAAKTLFSKKMGDLSMKELSQVAQEATRLQNLARSAGK